MPFRKISPKLEARRVETDKGDAFQVSVFRRIQALSRNRVTSIAAAISVCV